MSFKTYLRPPLATHTFAEISIYDIFFTFQQTCQWARNGATWNKVGKVDISKNI